VVIDSGYRRSVCRDGGQVVDCGCARRWLRMILGIGVLRLLEMV
jgi:hypothetical protein